MKTATLVLFFLLSLSVQAQQGIVDVQGFNFNYQDPNGSGTATSFSRDPKLSLQDVSLNILKTADGFTLDVSGAENYQFLLKDAPAFVTEAKTMVVENMNFNLSQSLSLSMNSGEFLSEKDELFLELIKLNCARETATAELIDQLISGCVRDLTLSASRFSSKPTQVVSKTSGSLAIKNLQLKSRDGKFDLSADVKAQISGKLRSHGYANYDPSTGILALKISEVKFGILNVKKMVFDELRKKQSETLVVKEPYVYFHLKK